MTVTLITGGNKGLGYETARRLIEHGHTVYIGARDVERGQQAASELGAKFVLLDVTDDATVDAAAAQIATIEGHLDVLINNAGTTFFSKPEDVTADQLRDLYETNVFGIVRVTNAFIPLLRKSEAPVIVNVSSGLGSFGMVTDREKMESKINNLAYSSSKAAVSMLTVQYAKGLPDICVNVADPGPTATDLNKHAGPQTVEQGTDAIVRLATIGKNRQTGTFIGRNGPVPW